MTARQSSRTASFLGLALNTLALLSLLLNPIGLAALAAPAGPQRATLLQDSILQTPLPTATVTPPTGVTPATTVTRPPTATATLTPTVTWTPTTTSVCSDPDVHLRRPH